MLCIRVGWLVCVYCCVVMLCLLWFGSVRVVVVGVLCVVCGLLCVVCGVMVV